MRASDCPASLQQCIPVLWALGSLAGFAAIDSNFLSIIVFANDYTSFRNLWQALFHPPGEEVVCHAIRRIADEFRGLSKQCLSNIRARLWPAFGRSKNDLDT